ncbi:MAG TPA: CaiB/BaiF CoA-transferase family protein [Acidimicrobiales bacterium]
MNGPLAGVRVVEFAAVVSAPLGAMVLADQGADVVKVESPDGGDLTRGRMFARGGLTAFFVNCNRGKRSVVVDTARPEGRRVVLDLIGGADVFIQNYRPGVVERLGLGYEDAAAVNPDIVYVSVSGYGDSGPYRDERVYDPIIQGLSGHIAAQVNPEVPIPDLVRNAVADKASAWAIAQAVTAALFARERGAGGQHIKIPMLDVSLAFFWPDGMLAHTMVGGDLWGVPLYRTYRLTRTADGHLIYFTATDREFAGLLRALGRAELLDEPRFQGAGRISEEMGGIIHAEFERWTTAEIVPRLKAEGVAVGGALSFDDVLADPQVAHNGAVVERRHPTAGAVREAAHPIRFAGTPTGLGPIAPLHGEHTDEVLASLGYDPDAIARMRQDGVVGGGT